MVGSISRHSWIGHERPSWLGLSVMLVNLPVVAPMLQVVRRRGGISRMPPAFSQADAGQRPQLPIPG